jgi:hypothetical protein
MSIKFVLDVKLLVAKGVYGQAIVHNHNVLILTAETLVPSVLEDVPNIVMSGHQN